ncbi:MAG: hypothetical protein QW356_07095 [Candidatus Hadarchaeales archaeon]
MFEPKFTITNKTNGVLLDMEKAKGFLNIARLKENDHHLKYWVIYFEGEKFIETIIQAELQRVVEIRNG